MASSPEVGRSRDYRLPVAVAVVAGVLIAGAGISLLPGRGQPATPGLTSEVAPSAARGFDGLPSAVAGGEAEQEEAPGNAAATVPAEARSALGEARVLLKERKYDQAIGRLDEARPLLKGVPEAYVLIGRALEGKKDHRDARDFFMAAINRDPYQYDAYWGVATTSEALGDLEMAMGAMRSYLHTEPDKDPNRLRIAQARSALWEWESQLGRGPWGPSKGVPPGFTAVELERDGRGVGVKMPVPGTQQPDGRFQSETKHANKQKIFSRW